MDILNFIDSKAIREHLHSINYQPSSSAEAAFIVWQSGTHSLEEKFKAWEWITQNMEDFDTISVFDRAYFLDKGVSEEICHSLHKGIKKYIELQKKLIEIGTKTEDNTVFSFEYYCKGDNDVCDDKRLFTTYKAIQEAIDKEMQEMSDFDVECIYIKKRWLNDEDGKHISITFLPNGEAYFVDAFREESFLGDERDYLELFHEMWFAIPTPFKKGDVLCVLRQFGQSYDEGPFVLEKICYWEYEDLEKERKRHAWCDMDMLAVGYFQNDDGRLYGETTHNYLILDYYEGKLSGTKRTLKALSNYFKGNTYICELLEAYSIIIGEERAKMQRKQLGILDEYMVYAGLKEETENKE